MDKKDKAEDWLTEDDFHQKQFLEAMDGDHDAAKTEIRAAKKMWLFLKSLQIRSLPDSEKDRLRRRIELSMTTRRKRRIWLEWSAAAILILGFLGSIWVYKESSVPPIMNYARNLKVPQPGNNTLLILNDNKEIQITRENSRINYQSGGKSISINQDQHVENIEGTSESGFHTVIVPYGKRLQMVLSDSTKVWLNSGSKLVYPAFFKTNKREVYLQGEAVFEVTHKENSNFFVRTGDFSVKVLGTVFNVTAYADDMNSSAVLERGHIEIISDKGIFSTKALDMNPGTMAVFDPKQNSFTSSKVDPNDYLSWRDGFLTLHSEKMINILRKLSRYYNVDIVLKDKSLESETFTGGLDLKNSPLEIFEVISRMVPLRAQEENGRITINSK